MPNILIHKKEAPGFHQGLKFREETSKKSSKDISGRHSLAAVQKLPIFFVRCKVNFLRISKKYQI